MLWVAYTCKGLIGHFPFENCVSFQNGIKIVMYYRRFFVHMHFATIHGPHNNQSHVLFCYDKRGISG
jgi:hypothetical protein